MSRIIKPLLISVAAVLFCVGGATVTQADTVTLTATNSGWYTNSGVHDDKNKNYFAGTQGSQTLNNFFVFDLTGVSGPIESAQLRLFTGQISGSGTFRLFDVSTPVSGLPHGTGGSLIDIFNDLGTGLSYGALDLTSADSNTVITIDLNAAAIGALQQANGSFAIGGFFDSATASFAFGETGASGLDRGTNWS